MDTLSLNVEQKRRLSSKLDVDISKLEIELATAMNELEQLHSEMKITKEQMSEIKAMLSENKDKLRSVSAVQQEIDKLMPLIEKARETIRAMGPEQLNEIASYKNPPERVRMVLEAIALIITGKKLTWDLIKKEMANDFVERVLKINWSKIKQSVLNQLRTDYFENPQWDIAKIHRASQAIGPLAEWMMGQKQIIDVQKKEEPNKEEVNLLYDERDKLETEEETQTEVFNGLASNEKSFLKIIEALNKRKTAMLTDKEQIDEALALEPNIEMVDAGAQTTENSRYIDGLVERHETALTDCEKLETDITELQEAYEVKLLKLQDDYEARIRDLEAINQAHLDVRDKQLVMVEDNLNNKNEYIADREDKIRDLELENDKLREELYDLKTKYNKDTEDAEKQHQHTLLIKNNFIDGLKDQIHGKDDKITDLEQELKKL